MAREASTDVQKSDSPTTTVPEQTRTGPLYSPAVDIFETDNSITLLADMPGVKASDLEIDLRENVLTLEKAVQQLPIGAVNIADREALIGSRPVHEGDLLVLELSGHQFVVWIQSIDQRGVQFCDINLQQHALKPFRFGPNELPGDSTGRQTDVRDFLKQDVH